MIHADMPCYTSKQKGRNTRMPKTTTRQDKTTRQDTQMRGDFVQDNKAY
jgi:hypothetical protein